MNALTGTRSLVRLALRRDRILLPVWIAVFVLIAVSSAGATAGLYPTAASLTQAAASIDNTPSLVALYGAIYDPTSLGAVAMFKLTVFGAAGVGVLSLILVIRHTRSEEEAGRLELVGAAVVGRHAPLTTALLIAVGTNVVLAVLTALGLMSTGLPAAGSMAFALVWAGVGVAFTAVAAIAAQLTASARKAMGMGAAILGAAYLLRAVGDTLRPITMSTGTAPAGPAWLSWLSPLGWGQQVRPYAGNQWWTLLLPAAFAVVLISGSYVLVAHRDHGAGLIPDRPAPASAAHLHSPLALAWRLHRGTLLAWTTGFVVLGVVLGSIASSIGNLLDNPQAQAMVAALGGEGALTDAFLSAELGLLGIIASVFGVQAALRLRSEETAQRAEPVLATPVSRIAWAGSHITLAMAGTAILLLGAGLSAGIAHAASIGDPGQIGRVLLGAMVRLPAVWVVTAIAVAAFGLVPRLVVVGWVALVAFLLLGELGSLLKLPQWAMDLSPYAHVPQIPGANLTAAPTIWLLAITGALIVAGLVGFRRRDIA